MQQKRSVLLTERFARYFVHYVRDNRLVLFSSMFFGMLAYVYAFTNKFLTHDEVGQIFSKGASIDSGRWGLVIMEKIFPNYSMPWIFGVITLMLMAISVSVIVRVFSIRSKLLQGLLAGTVVVFPSLIGLFGFMFTSTSYAVSFLMAVLAVYLLRRKNTNNVHRGGAICCMILSLSIYQAYVSVAASLLIVLLIQDILQKEDALIVLKKGLYYVGFLLLSMVIYYLILQVVMKITGISFNTYVGESRNFDVKMIPQRLITAYVMFVRLFTWGTRGLVPTSFLRKVHLLLFCACSILLIITLTSKKIKDIASLGLLGFLAVVFPLSVCCIFLISPDLSVHTLMLYGFVSVYILAVVVADGLMDSVFIERNTELLRRGCLNVVAGCLALILIGNTYIANQAYLNMQLRYENAYSFFSTVISGLMQNEEFTPDTKLALIGKYQEPLFYQHNFAFTDDVIGTRGFVPTDYSNESFLTYFMGVNIEMASEDEVKNISELEEVQDMGVYPYYGSIKRIGDYMVVRLS